MRKLFLALPFVVSSAFACPTDAPPVSKNEIAKEKKALQAFKVQKRNVAAAGPLNLPMNWGGPIAANWKAEAVLANAMSAALNEGWAQPGVSDVLVSAPVQMQYTNERVYGDGQTNTALSFGTWIEKEPPLVATLVILNAGRRRLHFKFSKKVQLMKPQIQVTSAMPPNFPPRKDQIFLTATAEGLVGVWEVPASVVFGDLEVSRLIWVRPEGWDSSFPLDFRQPVFPTAILVREAGSAKTVGQSPMDPIGIYRRSQQNRQLSKLSLMNSTYGPEWFRANGQVQLRNESIHGSVHRNGQELMTAVGGGDTWFVEAGPNSTFKNLYTCFDQRNLLKEAQMGVPSGGGWHEIGDAAETIINDLENQPIPVGFASGMPAPAPIDGSKFAWDLTDIATLRMLRPAEGIMTPAGFTTWQEDNVFRQSKHQDSGPRGHGPRAGRNYHWFLFPGNTPVCTQEWVHNCVPTYKNNLGLSCPTN